MDISGINLQNIQIDIPPAVVPLPNVQTWTSVNGVDGAGILYDDSQYVVASKDISASFAGDVRTSSNGASWTTQASVQGGNPVLLSKIGNRYYLGANRYSTDLVTWSNASVSGLTAPYTLYQAVSNGTAYMTVGYTTATPTELYVLTSANGTSWTVDATSNIQAGVRYFNGLAAANGGNFVLAGRYDISTSGSNVTVYTNNVNTGWGNSKITYTLSGANMQVSGGSTAGTGVNYVNGEFVIFWANTDTINSRLTSTTGNTWTSTAINSTDFVQGGVVTDLKHNGTYYLATGYSLDPSNNQYSVCISTDLGTWGNLNVPVGVGISSITYAAAMAPGGNRVVVPSGSRIRYGNLQP